MRLGKTVLMVLALAAASCTNDEPKAEEPVMTDDAKAAEGGSADDEADMAAPDAEGDGAASAAPSEPAAPEAPPPPAAAEPATPEPIPQKEAGTGMGSGTDLPAAQAQPSTPPPKPTGGIISSGVQPETPEQECTKVFKFNDRKKCFEKLRAAKKKGKG